jgi:NAD(P)-dependent dehydrogenase (short-subunit alcohol dehydrogenase family)
MKALITGASRGLGLALAGALAREGWELVLDARGGPELEKAAAELTSSRTTAGPGSMGTTAGPGSVRALAGDVCDPAHRAALIDAADGLDLLVNNASTLGATPLPALAAYPLEQLTQAFAVNTIAPLALIQGLLPVLRERRGAIVNISSDAATGPYEGWGGYGATKAALEQLSNVLAAEEPGVAVWWVDPGEMRTGMLAAAGEDAEAAPRPEDVAVPALLRLVAERLPSGRYTASGLVR